MYDPATMPATVEAIRALPKPVLARIAMQIAAIPMDPESSKAFLVSWSDEQREQLVLQKLIEYQAARANGVAQAPPPPIARQPDVAPAPAYIPPPQAPLPAPTQLGAPVPVQMGAPQMVPQAPYVAPPAPVVPPPGYPPQMPQQPLQMPPQPLQMPPQPLQSGPPVQLGQVVQMPPPPVGGPVMTVAHMPPAQPLGQPIPVPPAAPQPLQRTPQPLGEAPAAQAPVTASQAAVSASSLLQIAAKLDKLTKMVDEDVPGTGDIEDIQEKVDTLVLVTNTNLAISFMLLEALYQSQISRPALFGLIREELKSRTTEHLLAALQGSDEGKG